MISSSSLIWLDPVLIDSALKIWTPCMMPKFACLGFIVSFTIVDFLPFHLGKDLTRQAGLAAIVIFGLLPRLIRFDLVEEHLTRPWQPGCSDVMPHEKYGY